MQASERRVQDSQDRMLDYERRASDHKQLISELTQKVPFIYLCQHFKRKAKWHERTSFSI